MVSRLNLLISQISLTTQRIKTDLIRRCKVGFSQKQFIRNEQMHKRILNTYRYLADAQQLRAYTYYSRPDEYSQLSGTCQNVLQYYVCTL